VLTSFPDGPRSSSPSAVAFDSPRPGPGTLRDADGNVVLDWPSNQPIPSGWRVSRSVALLDHASAADTGTMDGGPLSVEEAFAALPRRIDRMRQQVENDLAFPSGDAFVRSQGLRLAEQLIREIEGIGERAERGEVPWDGNSPDPRVMQAAAKACVSYLRGYSRAAAFSGGPAAPNGAVPYASTYGDRAVSDEDLAFGAHREMKAHLSNAWRNGR
jgi:hypothetical protein